MYYIFKERGDVRHSGVSFLFKSSITVTRIGRERGEKNIIPSDDRVLRSVASVHKARRQPIRGLRKSAAAGRKSPRTYVLI